MVKVVNSGFGGYNQGGPLQISAPSVSAAPTNERFTAGITNYLGLITPTTPDVAPSTFPFWQIDWTRDTALPGQLVHSRTSSATYFNSSGYLVSASSDMPRLEYKPSNGSPAGFLVEEQRTNLFIRSGNLSDAAWSLIHATRSTDTTLGLDGTVAVKFITDAAAGTAHNFFNTTAVTISSGSTYSLSVYAKAGTSNIAFILLQDGGAGTNNITAIFDLSGSSSSTATETSTKGTATQASATSEYIRDGWFKLTLVGTIPATSCFMEAGMAGATTGNTYTTTGEPVFNGTGAQNAYFGFPQLELGAFSTSPIITTSAAATRSADLVSSTDSGLLGAKAWIVETGELKPGTAATLLGINTAIALGVTTGNALTTADGGVQTTGNTATWSDWNRSGIAWDAASRVSIVLDSGTVVTAANTAVTPTTLYFGNTNAGASGFLNGHIRSIAAYNSLSDTDLDTVSVVGSSFNIYGPAATNGVASSVGANTSSVTATWKQEGVAASAGANTSTVTATWKQEGVASSVGANTSTVTATWKQEGVAASVGANTSTVTATWKQEGVASSVGTNTSTVTATWLQAGVAASAGTNTSSAVSAPIQSMVAASAGSNTSSAVGSWLQSGVASSVGANTSAVTATWKQEGVAASLGANTSAVTATWLQAGVASSSGANTSSAVSAPIQSMVAASAGSNTSTAVGSWLQPGVASSAGANTVLVTAQWGQAGVASSSGTNLSSAYSAALPGVASSAGDNTAGAIGKWTQAGVASSVGTSTASAVGRGFQSGVASSVGSNVSAASGAWIQAGVATSATKELSDLLMETSGNLLMEDGSKILLDEGSDVTVRTNVFGAWTQSISLDFNQDFSNDFGVSGVGSTLGDFNQDFSNDFAVYRIGTRVTVSGTAVSVGSSIVSIVGAGGQAASLDFNQDFSGDFSVFGVTGADQGVAESAGSNIAAAVGSWEVIEAPPVYPVPEPVIKQWVPANEFQRVQQPRADRVYRTAPELRRVQPLTATRTFRTGTELRRVGPSNMKRRYG